MMILLIICCLFRITPGNQAIGCAPSIWILLVHSVIHPAASQSQISSFWKLLLSQEVDGVSTGYFPISIRYGEYYQADSDVNPFSIIDDPTLNTNDYLFNNSCGFRLIYDDNASYEWIWTQQSWLTEDVVRGSSLGEAVLCADLIGLGKAYGYNQAPGGLAANCSYLDGNGALCGWRRPVGLTSAATDFDNGFMLVDPAYDASSYAASKVLLFVCAGGGCDADSPLESYSYMGCYADQPGSMTALNDAVLGENYTVGECHIACSGFLYFSLQSGSHCFCENSYTEATQYGVSTTCRGGTGAASANDVYEHTALKSPTQSPTANPSRSPTASPSAVTSAPTKAPSSSPSQSPTLSPSEFPTTTPTKSPNNSPSESPAAPPSGSPLASPSEFPSTPPTTSTPIVSVTTTEKEGIVIEQTNEETSTTTETSENDGIEESVDNADKSKLAVMIAGSTALLCCVIMGCMKGLQYFQRLSSQILHRDAVKDTPSTMDVSPASAEPVTFPDTLISQQAARQAHVVEVEIDSGAAEEMYRDDIRTADRQASTAL